MTLVVRPCLICMVLSKKIVTTSLLKTESHPPTECASKLRCRGAYYQILVWMGNENGVDPLKWGWKIQNDRFYPIMTTKSAAPESLLKVATVLPIVRPLDVPVESMAFLAFGPCQFEECDNLKSVTLCKTSSH